MSIPSPSQAGGGAEEVFEVGVGFGQGSGGSFPYFFGFHAQVGAEVRVFGFHPVADGFVGVVPQRAQVAVFAVAPGHVFARK